MIILRQKEFNSKAAKALNNKYLKELAEKEGIKITADSKDWKQKARLINRAKQNMINASLPNVRINGKQMDRDRTRIWKETNPNKYFHGNRIERNMTSKLEGRDKDILKRSLLISKGAREAAKGLEKTLETGKKWTGENKSGMKKTGIAAIGGLGSRAARGLNK